MFYNFLSEKYYYRSEYDQAFGVRHQGIWGAQQFLTARKISVRNKQSKSRTPKGKRKKNNKQENEFGDKNNLETGLK